MNVQVVRGGIFEAKKTACSYEAMDNNDEYEGLGDIEVKDRVIPLLVAMENGDDAVLCDRGGAVSCFRSCDLWKEIFEEVLR